MCIFAGRHTHLRHCYILTPLYREQQIALHRNSKAYISRFTGHRFTGRPKFTSHEFVVTNMRYINTARNSRDSEHALMENFAATFLAGVAVHDRETCDLYIIHRCQAALHRRVIACSHQHGQHKTVVLSMSAV